MHKYIYYPISANTDKFKNKSLKLANMTDISWNKIFEKTLLNAIVFQQTYVNEFIDITELLNCFSCALTIINV